jgi:FKBP-type peptidyl-prolyl cis-trans isomerase
MLILPLLAAVVLSPQGKLQITDKTVGKGPAAKAGDTVTVDYKGTLLNGKVFDQSTGKAPFSFTIGAGQVIKGWDQGLVGMKVGGKRVLTIPPALAYGSQGAPPDIPANATLKFEITLYHIRAKGSKPKLEIKDLAPGKGPAAKDGDTVQVHYRGKFLNGVQFDTSYGRGTFPVTLGAGGVIPGFDQALHGMKAGGKRRVVIPPELGYGAQGAGGVIPPNTTLVFELEVVKIGK